MRRHNSQKIRKIAAASALAAATLVVLTSVSFAAPGAITSNVNVRQGPSTSSQALGIIRAGTVVDVRDCRGGFCFVDQRQGPDGYVSADFINGGTTGGARSPGVGLQVGPGGVQIQVGPGGRPPRDLEEDDEEESVAEVCFFDRTRFRGDSFCAEEGESIRRLGEWADRISSIENDDGLEVRVCLNNDFRSCRMFEDSVSTLGDYDDDISSIQVR